MSGQLLGCLPTIFLCKTMLLRVASLIALAATLASCSLFEGETFPQGQPAFFYTTQPRPICIPPNCARSTTDASLVAKADSSFGFGEGLTTFIILTLPDRSVSLFNTGLNAADLALVEGRPYRFEADAAIFGLSFPNLTALRVSDTDGLVLYGASSAALPDTDTEGAGIDELLLLPEGWTVRVEKANFGSKPTGCGAATPYRVVVAHEGSTLRLLQGEHGQIGSFDVQIRAASSVLYDGSCLDGYVHEFSMVIARLNEPGGSFTD